jgi:hypothetical protein
VKAISWVTDDLPGWIRIRIVDADCVERFSSTSLDGARWLENRALHPYRVQPALPASIPRPNQPLPAQTPNLKVRLEY